jgi:hypothetical protein
MDKDAEREFPKGTLRKALPAATTFWRTGQDPYAARRGIVAFGDSSQIHRGGL